MRVTATSPSALLPATPAAIREWLSRHAPEDAQKFEAEYHASLDNAGQTYDLQALDATIRQWWAHIWGRTQQLTPDELDQLKQFEATGDASPFLPHVL